MSYEPTPWAPHEEFKEREEWLKPAFPRLPCEMLPSTNSLLFPNNRDNELSAMVLFLRYKNEDDPPSI